MSSLSRGVGVHLHPIKCQQNSGREVTYERREPYLALAARTGDNVDETAGVDFALVSTTLGGLGLLLGLNLGSLRLDLA